MTDVIALIEFGPLNPENIGLQNYPLPSEKRARKIVESSIIQPCIAQLWCIMSSLLKPRTTVGQGSSSRNASLIVTFSSFILFYFCNFLSCTSVQFVLVYK